MQHYRAWSRSRSSALAASSSPGTSSPTCAAIPELSGEPAPRAARHQRGAAGVRRGADPADRRADWQPAPTVTASASRAEALDGADYVINEVQVGGYAATRHDFDIPARYGVRQTIADTLGIGGIFRGLRTIPVVLGIAGDMLDVCPDAYPAQLQQPDGDAALGGLRRDRVPQRLRPVPLGPRHARVPGRAGRRPDAAEIDFLTAGFNHQAFVLRFEHQGQSPVPAAGRGHRRLARAAAPGPGGDLPPVRLLPDRVQRALRRVRALVHAPRRPGRAVPHLRRRLPGPVGGEPARARRAHRAAGLRRAARPDADQRAGVASSSTRWRPASRARDLRQRPQRRPDHQPAAGLLRRGALRRRLRRRQAARRSARCRRSSPR